MNKTMFSDELSDLAWMLRDVELGRAELAPQDVTDIRIALQKAGRIISVLESRSRSLNNLRDEVNSYIDEFNKLIG